MDMKQRSAAIAAGWGQGGTNFQELSGGFSPPEQRSRRAVSFHIEIDDPGHGIRFVFSTLEEAMGVWRVLKNAKRDSDLPMQYMNLVVYANHHMHGGGITLDQYSWKDRRGE